MDGIDVALVRSDGRQIVERGPARTYDYDDDARAVLARAMADAQTMTGRGQRPGGLAGAEDLITQLHDQAVSDFLSATQTRPGAVDVIGFHGQTVIHRPQQQLTVQLGDGAKLARMTGIDVIGDLRAGDVAAGGQGAPLVPVYHRALAGMLAERPVAFVNIGGVSNVTYVGRSDDLLAFDTGPGNALLDDWVRARTGAAFDLDGALAAMGQVDQPVVEGWLAHRYFDLPVPKSLDRNDFAGVMPEHMSTEDGAATLTAFTAQAIAGARAFFPGVPRRWIICGGGCKNPVLMGQLRVALETGGAVIDSADEAGFDSAAMEAEAFGYLAIRAYKGLALTYPGTTGVAAAQTGGVLHKAGTGTR